MPSLGSAPRPTWRSDKLTARAKKAAHLAEEEARRSKSSRIGSEHLLLGLIREGEGVAAKVLQHHGLELEATRDAVAKADTSDPAVRGSAGIDWLLDRAREEAQTLGHNFVGTEHLLLALLHEDHGLAVGLLQELGADPQALAADVIKVVSIAAQTSVLVNLSSPKDNVLTCRVDDHALDAIDALVEAGIRSTRSDAAAWLIRSGIEANREFFEQVYTTVGEIRRLREQAQALARQSPSAR